jgi:uncharacterized protein involved in tolerance to divalent cations
MKIYDQYIEVSREYKALEAKKKDLASKILEDFKKKNIQNIQDDRGTLCVSSRSSYSYSDKVEKAKENLAILKHKEEKSGVAQASSTEFIQFKPAKK